MEIIQEIAQTLTGGSVIALMVLLAANFILALIAAIRTKTFNLAKLSDFIPRRIAPFLAYVVVAVLAAIIAEFEAVAVTVYVVLTGLYIKGILAAIKSITGISIPDTISEKIKE